MGMEMEKSKLLWLLGILESWFYISALVFVFSLWKLARKLNMPIMQPYKSVFKRLAVCGCALFFCAIAVIIYFLTNRTFWQILVVAELGIGSSFTYFVWKLPHAWREIQHSSEINELRFIESKRFKAILDTTPNATISFNSKKQVIDWNKSAERIFQRKEEEMVGKNVLEVICAGDREKFEKRIQSASKFSDLQPYLRKRIKSKGLRRNGEEFPIEIFLSYYVQNNDVFFTALVRDLTEE